MFDVRRSTFFLNPLVQLSGIFFINPRFSRIRGAFSFIRVYVRPSAVPSLSHTLVAAWLLQEIRGQFFFIRACLGVTPLSGAKTGPFACPARRDGFPLRYLTLPLWNFETLSLFHSPLHTVHFLLFEQATAPGRSPPQAKKPSLFPAAELLFSRHF